MTRKATGGDVEAVAKIYSSARRRYVGFAALIHSEDEIRRWIGNELVPSGSVLVLEQNDIVRAMMVVSTSRDVSWIDHLYVDPDFVRQGLGSLLLEEAKRELELPIQLYCFQQNLAACRFYEHHGFRACRFSEAV